MGKRKTQTKMSSKGMTKTTNTPTPYSRRTRKNINYTDQDNAENSDSDFESTENNKPEQKSDSDDDSDVPLNKLVQKQKTKPKKQTVKKSASKTKQRTKASNISSQRNIETSHYFNGVIGAQTPIICKPNLSEDESSGSSDDEDPVFKNKQPAVVRSNSISPIQNEPSDPKLPEDRVQPSTNVLRCTLLSRNFESESIAVEQDNVSLQNSKQQVSVEIEQIPNSSLSVEKSYTNVLCSTKRTKRNILHSVDDDKPTKTMKLEVQDCETPVHETIQKKSTTNRSKLRLKKKKVDVSIIEEPMELSMESIQPYSNVDKKVSSDEESDDWEDVDEAKIKLSPKKKRPKKQIVKHEKELEIKDLQISVGVKSIHKKKKSREEKMLMWLRQSIGRFQRERQVLIHKCHLLALFARVLQNNTLCNSHILQGVLLSLVPSDFMKPLHKKWDISHLRRLLQWFQRDIPSVAELLLFTDNATKKMKFLTRAHIFVMLLRSMGFTARLVVSLQPCSSKLKQAYSLLNSPETNITSQKDDDKSKIRKTEKETFDSKHDSTKQMLSPKKQYISPKKEPNIEKTVKQRKKIQSPYFKPENSEIKSEYIENEQNIEDEGLNMKKKKKKKKFESTRHQSESTKQQSESTKRKSESAKQKSESTKQQPENTKQQSESTKRKSESAKHRSESTKQQSESTKRKSESAKQKSESTKQQPENTKRKSESTKQKHSIDQIKHYSHRKIKRISYNEEKTESEASDKDVKNTDQNNKKTKRIRQNANDAKMKIEKTTSNENDIDDDDDFDLSEEVRRSKHNEKRRTGLGSKSSSSNTRTKDSKSGQHSSRKCVDKSLGVDTWIEVYLLNMKGWITIELTTESINEPVKCEQVATKPLKYIIAIDNDQKVKDITCRYAEKWLSYNRKLRIDREWWAQTLRPYEPSDDVINKTEDAKLKKTLLEQDFPKAISEFKDNPLYALKRHLLKFEAIYPESAVPLGYIRTEAIYSRDCVHETKAAIVQKMSGGHPVVRNRIKKFHSEEAYLCILRMHNDTSSEMKMKLLLHTRETWMKQARTVKPAEVPYKIVKGRPKRNTPVLERDNIKVQVFGLWQTEPYVPPPVKDGKVPKNEYGNVELFKPTMLPEGAIHLPMNNMQKIARKLKIDFAPAMMGWDFHGGWSHPVIEGIVVAKEYEDVLLDAWREEEAEQERKDKEKREKIIYENWKLLIRGILIRHKLKSKYKFEDEEPPSTKTATKKASTSKSKSNNRKKTAHSKAKAKDEYSDLSVSWPMNRMDGKTTLADEGHVHIFPESSHELDPRNNVMMKTCACGLSMPVDNEEML